MDETTGNTPPAPEPPAAPQPPAAPVPPPPAVGGRPGPESDTSKLLAALGYLIWPVALIAILIDPYKNEKFVKFHGYQALGLGLAVWVLGAVTSAFLVGYFVWLAGFVYQIILAVKAWNGEYVEIPVVYGVVKSMIGE